MEVTVQYLGAVQFEVHARNHMIICDQPEENGGLLMKASHRQN